MSAIGVVFYPLHPATGIYAHPNVADLICELAPSWETFIQRDFFFIDDLRPSPSNFLMCSDIAEAIEIQDFRSHVIHLATALFTDFDGL